MQIRIVRKSQNNVSLFDAELVRVEVRNFERSMKIHLRRCDDIDAAREIGEVLDALSKGFIAKGNKRMLEAA